MEKQRQDYNEAVKRVESMFANAKTHFETARQDEQVCMCISHMTQVQRVTV